jgi:hypothetical protein
MPWDFLRVAVLFGPVWFVTLLTFAIYLRAGLVIHRKRRQIRALRALGGIDSPDSRYALVNYAGIQVTHEIDCSTPERPSPAVPDVDVPVAVPARSLTSSTFSPYSVTIERSMMDPASSEERLQPIQPSSLRRESRLHRAGLSQKTFQWEGVEEFPQQRMITEPSSAAWAYTKYAMLFFITLLVTWVCYLPRVIRAYSMSAWAKCLTLLSL